MVQYFSAAFFWTFAGLEVDEKKNSDLK